MSSTVKSVAYVHTVDIDPSVVKNGAVWEAPRKHLRDCCRESARDTAPRLHGHAAQFTHGYLCLDEGDTPFDPVAGRARRRETGISGCARARAAPARGALHDVPPYREGGACGPVRQGGLGSGSTSAIF